MLTNRLSGTWSVEKLEISALGSLPFAAPLYNVGTIVFDPNGSGKNNIYYKYSFGNQAYEVNDQETFHWNNTKDMVTLTGNANSGEKTIVWVVERNKKMEQVWTRTDDLGLSYEMTLSKQD